MSIVFSWSLAKSRYREATVYCNFLFPGSISTDCMASVQPQIRLLSAVGGERVEFHLHFLRVLCLVVLVCDTCGDMQRTTSS